MNASQMGESKLMRKQTGSDLVIIFGEEFYLAENKYFPSETTTQKKHVWVFVWFLFLFFLLETEYPTESGLNDGSPNFLHFGIA